jgi:hypothetical protein
MTGKIDGWVEKREFVRLQMKFMVKVTASNLDGEEFFDNAAALFDVSGGGAKIMTDHRERYFTDQSLELTIYLPSVEEGRAFMKGKATVKWVGNELSMDGSKAGVGVHFDEPLNFNRDIKEKQGSDRGSCGLG